MMILQDLRSLPSRLCRKPTCGATYQPTSGVQKYCPVCSAAAKLANTRKWQQNSKRSKKV